MLDHTIILINHGNRILCVHFPYCIIFQTIQVKYC